MATLKELIEYSRQNPDSDIAIKTRRAIEGGAYDAEAAQTGVDLSWAGRPTATPASAKTAPPDQAFQSPLTRIAAGKGAENVEVAKGAGKQLARDIVKPLGLRSPGLQDAGPVGAAIMEDARQSGNEFAGAIESFDTATQPDNALQREGGRGTTIAELPLPVPKTLSGASTVAKTAAAPFKSSFDAHTAAKFAEEGITAPISAVTNSPFLKSLEAMTAKGLFGGKVMDQVTGARTAIDSKIAATAEAAMPKKTMSKEGLGKTMADDLRASLTTFKDKQDKVFTQFSKYYGDHHEAPMNTLEALQNIVSDQGRDFFKGVDPRLQKMFERLSGDTKIVKDARKQGLPPDVIESMKAGERPTMSISEMRSTRTSIGEHIAKDPDNGALKHIYGALTNDLKAALGVLDKAGADMMQRLDADYAKGISKLEGRIAQSIEQANPENIVHKLFARDSADAIHVLKGLVKPETFDEYRTYFLNDIFSKSSVRGKFSVEALRKSLAQYDQPTLDAVLDAEHKQMLEQIMTRLDKLEGLSDKIKPTEKLLGGSQTAFLQQAAVPATAAGALAGALSTGNLALAAAIAGGLAAKYGVAKLFTTKFGRKFLTKGAMNK